MITTTGIIQEIGETKVYPKKAGEGNVEITKLKIDGKYYTSFEKRQVEALKVGSVVDVEFSSKENEYQGKTYINNNISTITLHSEVDLLPETLAKIEAVKQVMETTGTNATDPNFDKNVKRLMGQNTINLGDKTFKITLEEIK